MPGYHIRPRHLYLNSEGMMTDTVAWLREIAGKTVEGPKLREAADEIERLRAALKDMFALIDEGWLVRNTANDAESSWGVRQLGYVRRLQNAQAALAVEQKAMRDG